MGLSNIMFQVNYSNIVHLFLPYDYHTITIFDMVIYLVKYCDYKLKSNYFNKNIKLP